MGRGRNGVKVQTTSKNKKRIYRDVRNEDSYVFTRNNVPSRKEDFFLEPDFVNHLRSLDPREVAKTLKC